MKIPFRREREKKDADDLVSTYQEPASRSEARWSRLKVYVHEFPLPRIELRKARKFLVGSPNSVEYTFENGTVVVYTPERTVKTHDQSEETTTFPENIGVFETVQERTAEGHTKAVLKLLFHLEPERKIFYDYTDPNHPNGKTVTNTAEPHFQAVEELIYDIRGKKDEIVRRSYF